MVSLTYVDKRTRASALETSLRDYVTRGVAKWKQLIRWLAKARAREYTKIPALDNDRDR